MPDCPGLVVRCLLHSTMAFYLYKKIKASRAEKAAQEIPLGNTQSSPFEDTPLQQDGVLPSDDSQRPLQEKPSPEVEAEKRRMRIYRWKLIGSLFLPYLLASIDLTIVATAVPFIASHFGMSPCLVSQLC